MKIGSIGSGNIGGGLTRRFRAAGHAVAVAPLRLEPTMLDRRHFLETAAIGGTSLAGAAIGSVPTRKAVAQTATPAAAPAGISASVRLNELGPENGALARRVGLWDVTETAWDSPNAAPVTTTGLVAERVMMGSLLQEFIRPPSDPAPEAVERTDLLSFNRVEGRWCYISFDTRVPAGLMPAWSSVRGDGATIELTFAPFAITGPGTEVTGQLLRMEQVIRYQGPDRDVKDQFFTVADGTGTKWLAHRYDYARRA